MGEGFDVRDVGAAVVAVYPNGHGGDAQGTGGDQVGRVVVDHQAAAGVLVDDGQRFVEGFNLGLAVGIEVVDINDPVEMPCDAQARDDPFGMGCVGIGEDHLALWQGMQKLIQLWVWRENILQGDIVDVIQVIIHIHFEFNLQTPQSGAVLLKEARPQAGDLVRRKPHLLQEEPVNPVTDTAPDTALMGVKGVIQVDQQAADVFKGLFGCGLFHRQGRHDRWLYCLQ